MFTIQQTHGERELNILMLGGKHIRSTRTQIKLFRQFGHELIIMSPPSPVENNDIDDICKNEFREEDSLEAIKKPGTGTVKAEGLQGQAQQKTHDKKTPHAIVSRVFVQDNRAEVYF